MDSDLASMHNLLRQAMSAILLVIAGVALSLAVWVIPIILMAPNSKTKTIQFCAAVDLGGRYLQSSSRAVTATLALTALLTARDFGSCVVYVRSVCILILIAPYEIYLVFPTNDILQSWRDELITRQIDNFDDSKDARVDTLLLHWQRRHIPRIVLPFVAAVLLQY